MAVTAVKERRAGLFCKQPVPRGHPSGFARDTPRCFGQVRISDSKDSYQGQWRPVSGHAFRRAV